MSERVLCCLLAVGLVILSALYVSVGQGGEAGESQGSPFLAVSAASMV